MFSRQHHLLRRQVLQLHIFSPDSFSSSSRLYSPPLSRFLSSSSKNDDVPDKKKTKERKVSLTKAKNATLETTTTTAAVAPPIVTSPTPTTTLVRHDPKATPLLFVGKKPLLPQHIINLSGDADNRSYLTSIFSALIGSTPLCALSVPDLQSTLPRIGTLVNLLSLKVVCGSHQHYFVSSTQKLYVIDETGLAVEQPASPSQFLKLSQEVIVNWDAQLEVVKFVDCTKKEESVVEFKDVTDLKPDTVEDRNREWAKLNQSLMRFFKDPVLQSHPSKWRETCVHLLYVFQQIPSADIQRVLDCANATEGYAVTNELILRESQLSELQAKVMDTIHQEHNINMYKELIRRSEAHLEKLAPSSQGGGGAGGGRHGSSSSSKSATHKLHERMKQFANGAKPNEEEEKERIRLEEEYWKQQVELGGTPLCMPTAVKLLFDEEMAKLETLDKSNEFQTTFNFLDWLSSVPWGRTTAPSFDVKRTMDILNRDHFGMEPVKKRIAEFVAVSKLNAQNAHATPSKILCLVGPPGVGKTSICKSIAEALNKKFYRFSVGGLRDASEIKGHRRTYVGSRPGKLIECLKQVKCMNPLMLIDEVDKISRGNSMQGDPSGSLLELLDPSQNKTFRDSYLDVEVDASQVLFVCTANELYEMSRPLRDRMEVIELSGYDNVEKVHIAKLFLEKKLRLETGVTEKMFAGLSEKMLHHLVREYSREPGVRKLTQVMEKIYRAVALVVEKRKGKRKLPVVDTKEDLEKLIGPSQQSKERLFGDHLPSGVCTGLGTNGLEGIMLYIECAALEKAHGGFSSTGNLAQTMKESLELAHANAKRMAPDYFDKHQIQLHVPYGGIPKDGPSAGMAMTIAQLSLAWQLPVDAFLAMTGEITLTGKIVGIGGVREKTLAARRSGTTTMILPLANRHDWMELADHLKEGMTVHFVEDIKECIPLVFPTKSVV